MLILDILRSSWDWSKISLVLGVAALLNGIYLRYWHPLAKYPGPFWASITNLWRFITFYGGEHHLIDQKLHAEYGPVVRTGPNSLSFSTLEAYDSIYGFHATTEKGDWYQPTRDTDSNHGPMFGIRTNEEHRMQRKKVLVASFGSTKVAMYRPIIERHVEDFLQEIKTVRADSQRDWIDFADILHHFTFDAFYEISFGEPPQYNTLEDRVKTGKAIQGANKGLGAGYLPWLGSVLSSNPVAKFIRRPKSNKDGQLMGFSAIARQSFQRVLGSRQEVLESPQPSIIQNLFLASENSEKGLTDRVIALESFNSLFAGPGSVTAALATILFHLAQPAGQPWQDRILKEHAEQSSTSLTAVIKETLRVNPSFPTGIPRTTTTTTPININDSTPPIAVPANTHVSCNLYILSRSEEIWGSQAASWLPERWLREKHTDTVADEDEKNLQHSLSPEERFIVFGRGPRSCIGREIAMIMLTETIVSILKEYHLKSARPLQGKNFFEMQYTQVLLELVAR